MQEWVPIDFEEATPGQAFTVPYVSALPGKSDQPLDAHPELARAVRVSLENAYRPTVGVIIQGWKTRLGHPPLVPPPRGDKRMGVASHAHGTHSTTLNLFDTKPLGQNLNLSIERQLRHDSGHRRRYCAKARRNQSIFFPRLPRMPRGLCKRSACKRRTGDRPPLGRGKL